MQGAPGRQQQKCVASKSLTSAAPLPENPPVVALIWGRVDSQSVLASLFPGLTMRHQLSESRALLPLMSPTQSWPLLLFRAW